MHTRYRTVAYDLIIGSVIVINLIYYISHCCRSLSRLSPSSSSFNVFVGVRISGPMDVVKVRADLVVSGVQFIVFFLGWK